MTRPAASGAEIPNAGSAQGENSAPTWCNSRRILVDQVLGLDAGEEGTDEFCVDRPRDPGGSPGTAPEKLTMRCAAGIGTICSNRCGDGIRRYQRRATRPRSAAGGSRSRITGAAGMGPGCPLVRRVSSAGSCGVIGRGLAFGHARTEALPRPRDHRPRHRPRAGRRLRRRGRSTRRSSPRRRTASAGCSWSAAVLMVATPVLRPWWRSSWASSRRDGTVAGSPGSSRSSSEAWRCCTPSSAW